MPRTDGSPVGRLFIPAEQGLGDMLQFSRWVAAAAPRAAHLIVAVQEELIDAYRYVLTESMASYDLHALPCMIPQADAFCPVMSLPHALGAAADAANLGPVLYGWQPVPARIESAPGVRRVGIVWRGSPEHENDRNRSCTLDDMLGLYENHHDIQLYSLQLDADVRGYDPLVLDLGRSIRSFADTAAILRGLDAVVTVDTAVAHLGGSLGVPTHVLLPNRQRHWAWGMARATPWYPSVRLWRQIPDDAPGAWGRAVRAVQLAFRQEGSN